MSKVARLTCAFACFTSPSLSVGLVSKALEGECVPTWAPPPPALSRTDAVEVVLQFMDRHRGTISSTSVAAQALCGVSVMSGEGLSLLHSTFLRDPFFGKLSEFDFFAVYEMCRLQAEFQSR